jgi:hypothetical protein
VASGESDYLEFSTQYWIAAFPDGVLNRYLGYLGAPAGNRTPLITRVIPRLDIASGGSHDNVISEAHFS